MKTTVTNQNITFDGVTSKDIFHMSTEERFKYFNIDPNLYEISRFSCSQGHTENAKGQKSNRYNFNASFKLKTSPTFNREMIDSLFEEIETTKYYQPDKSIKPNKNSKMAVLGMFDFHIGKLAVKSMTGDNYNLQIVKNIFEYITTETIQIITKENISTVMIPVGQDLLHYDNTHKTTTSGTPQDSDLLWIQMFNEACQCMITTINTISEHCKVKLVWSAGNHDNVLSYCCYKVLEAYYSKTSNIECINNEQPRFYYNYGNSLLCITHLEKNEKRIFTTIASEASELWGKTTERHVITGHLHSYKCTEESGIFLHRLSSFSGTDNWHNNNLYVGAKKQMQVLLFDRKQGLTQTTHIIIPKDFYV